MQRFLSLLALSIMVALAAPARAHFPFILTDPNGAPRATIVSDQTPAPADEVAIELVSRAKRTATDKAGVKSPLELEKGKDVLKASLIGVEPVVLSGVVDVGVMQRGKSPAHLLVYYPKT